MTTVFVGSITISGLKTFDEEVGRHKLTITCTIVNILHRLFKHLGTISKSQRTNIQARILIDVCRYEVVELKNVEALVGTYVL